MTVPDSPNCGISKARYVPVSQNLSGLEVYAFHHQEGQ